MEQLSRQELEAIIERDLPDHELVTVEREPTDQAPVEADEAGEDIDALRERFLGRTDASDAPEAGDARNEHDLIVAVRPKRQGDPYDHLARPKTVIVSGRDRRVIGSQ